MKPQIAFLGLGTMGFSMSKNLLSQGYPLRVWNRSAEKAQALKEFGAVVCKSPQEAVEGCAFVFSCLTNAAALLDVLSRPGDGLLSAAALPGAVIDFSTIAPQEAREIAALLMAQGVGFLDCPVTGGDVGARNATLTMMVGGSESLLTEVTPVLSTMGKKILWMGPIGSGQLSKCANQIAVAGAVAAMCEALSFARSSGLSTEKVLDVLQGGAAGSWALTNYGPRLLKGDYAPGFLAEHMLKDLRLALEEGKNLDAQLPLTELMEKLYAELCQHVLPGTVGNHGIGLLYERLSK